MRETNDKEGPWRFKDWKAIGGKKIDIFFSVGIVSAEFHSCFFSREDLCTTSQHGSCVCTLTVRVVGSSLFTKKSVEYELCACAVLHCVCSSRANGESIKLGLDRMGQLIDQGYSVVVFPEGKMSESGELLALKRGAGLMSVEMKCPVVPIKIIGTADIVPYPKIFPRKTGKVYIKIGKPIDFKTDDSYEYVTEKIEEALKVL